MVCLTLLPVSKVVWRRMRNISDKLCGESQNTHFMFSNFPKNLVVYEIMSKDVVEPEKPQMAMWRMPVACWIIKATRA